MLEEKKDIDLRAALNAVSDVVQNRPRPLRELDQIYMKSADMVLQSEFVARWANGKRLAFIGDGDAISVCVAYLKKRGIIDYGPAKITVFDFDERICRAVTRFADSERLDWLESRLYNCIDPISATNPNLHAQAGLMIVDSNVGTPLPLEVVVEQLVSANPARFPSVIFPVLWKLTVPSDQAGRLLRLLSNEHVNAATVTPGHRGVVDSLEERSHWRT